MQNGTFNRFIAVDCETSGFCSELGEEVCKDHQSVSWGFVLSDIETFKPIDECYVLIKPNGIDKWGYKAEQIHGLTKDFLNANGLSESDAADKIVTFLSTHLDLNKPINCLGHNVASFDIPFLKKLLYKHEYYLKFSQRVLDTFSLSMGTVQDFNSNELFETMGLGIRKEHNSLEDAKMALECYRRINKIWKKKVLNSI